jgi:hypothetical protein
LAARPFNVTVLPAGAELKFDPEMVTVVPIVPLDGEIFVMDGGGIEVVVDVEVVVVVDEDVEVVEEGPEFVPFSHWDNMRTKAA